MEVINKYFYLILMILLLDESSFEGCLEHERIALLEIKASFNFSNDYHSYWGSDLDCCNWHSYRIECNKITGQVTGLDLSTMRGYEDLGDWYLNASLFLPFQQLKYLSLRGNNIVGCIKDEGFERLSTLANLETLDLGENNFSNNILSSLSSLSSLKYLYLYYNKLNGTIDMKELEALNNLEELSLGGNEITKLVGSRGLHNLSVIYLEDITINGRSELLESLGTLPYLKTLYISWSNFTGMILSKGYHNLTNVEELYLDFSSLGLLHFNNLEHLYLNYSTVNNSFLQTIETMTSLKTLSLRGCGLSGTINQGLCKLKNLQQLDISYNNFSGSLPWCFANLTFIQRLDLSSNHFIGNIYLFQDLTSLEYLSLSDNFFQIPVSLSPLFNHSKLKYLDGSGNKLCAEMEDNNWKFQLETLVLSGIGYSGRAFPKFLYYQHNLQYVDLSDFQIMELFPYWLLENNTELENLYLVNNSLFGPLQLPIHSPFINLSHVDISNNQFHAYIPKEIGAYFPRLIFLNISTNGFSGIIPSSFGNMSLLQTLDMSNNKLSGSIPEQLTIGCVSLNFLWLSNNSLQGQLFSENIKLTNLMVLDLSQNSYGGSIPKWIGNFSILTYLLLSHNKFEGQIPTQICKLNQLSLIDLSHNNLSGHILPCLTSINPMLKSFPYIPKPLKFTTKGISYSYETSILMLMSGIDLSCNKFTGQIPLEIGNLVIHVLNLSHNCLTGTIPTTFSNLHQIESLDLSHNNLQGKIPPQLTQLYSLEIFNVSYNNLSGMTLGKAAQFETFDESSYRGNPFLCGWPLPESCSNERVPPPSTSTNDHEEDNSFMDMGVFYVSFGVTYVMLLLVMAIVLYINPYWRRMWFYFIEVSIENCYYFIIDICSFI